MSDSQPQNNQSNTADLLPDPTAGTGPGVKPVDIDAPYEHAPPKDGDPWTTLLTPELEADTLRCNAWKDEVQNLLIFAGLFSAVVTTFIVESYKLLLPDPNAAMIGLLFHIASGLNNTSPFPPSVIPESILAPFSQPTTAVRINVFWFISLILSLTTVLVGTIALQWLREHQSYGGYSSKEKFAMLHMRSEAMEAWYLPQVFAALPLLLQAALVLFLAGLIDFSLPLGTKLTIPVSIVVGLTLLFLAAMTILPSLQGLAFFCGLYPRKTLPTPCPFKSPQSQAFRALFRVVVRAILHVFPFPELVHDHSSPNREDWKWIIQNRSFLIADHLVPSVRKMWNQRTWPTLDREWLSLRDACHQRIIDNDADLYQHLGNWKDSFPLSDVTRYLVEMVWQTPGFKHTNSFLAALVYCFNELAESTWITSEEYSFDRKDRRSNYFEHLHSSLVNSCSLSNFLLHGGIYKFDQLKQDDLEDYIQYPEFKLQLFSTDQTMIFLRQLLYNHPSPALSQYHQELWMRVLYLVGNIAPLTPAITDGSQSIPISAIIERSTVTTIIYNNITPNQHYLKIANILTTIFQLAASHHVSQDWATGSVLAHPEMPRVLKSLAFETATNYLQWAQVDPLTKQDIVRDIDDQLTQFVKFTTDHLNAWSNTSSNSQNESLDILFYFTSIFLWHLLRWGAAQKILGNQDSHFGLALRSLLNALHKMWISGQKNGYLEKWFEGDEHDFVFGTTCTRFSDKWWNQIFQHLTDAHTIGQGSHSAAEGPPDAHPNPLTQSASPPENETKDDNDPLAASSPGSLCPSPEPDMLDSGALPSHHFSPPADYAMNHDIRSHSRPSPSSRRRASSAAAWPTDSDARHDSRADAERGHTPHLPGAAVCLCAACHLKLSLFPRRQDGRIVLPDPLAARIEVAPVGRSFHAQADRRVLETRDLWDKVPQAPSSPSVADTDSVAPQEAAGDTSRSDKQDLHPDGLHLAIDVGSPTSSEHVEAEKPGAGGDRSLDEADPEDAVTPSSVPQPSPSPSAADPDGAVPQQVAGNGTSRSDEQDLQPEPDGHHLAIDVGSPTSSGQVDADAEALVGAGGDRSLDEAELEDAVIRIESPI